jgi:O-antigen ligase
MLEFLSSVPGVLFTGQRALSLPFIPLHRYRFEGFLSHPNVAGGIFAAGVLLECVRVDAKRPSRTWWLWTSIELYLLLETGSQTSIVAAALTVLLAFVPLRSPIVVAAILCVAISFAPAAFEVFGHGPDPISPNFATGRGVIWNTATGLVRPHEYFGLRTGSTAPLGQAPNLLYDLTLSGHTHNVVLQVWLTGGFFLLACYCLFIVISIFYSARSKWRNIALASFAVLSVTEIPLFQLPGSWNACIVCAAFGTVFSRESLV